ncbi:MAG: response regulator [Hyphomicrobiaceae bacterium]|nr:response regulator [Hyphomicrobiaceae bacterium]
MGALQTKILVVDDDDDIRGLLVGFLTEEGFVAAGACDAPSMDAAIARSRPDLVVLDLMLPGEDGLSICRRLRSTSGIPVIMLTARSAEVDRIVGLEIGADDYVTKPFSKRELVARIRSVLRRGGTAQELNPPKSVLRFNHYMVDVNARRMTDQSGRDIALTSAEFDLLVCFMQSPQRVLSRDQLLDRVHGRNADPFDRSIDTLVSRLRKKIEVASDNDRLIATIRNHGYLFTPTVQIVSQ